MNWDQFLQYAFPTIITGCIVYGVTEVSKMRSSMDGMNLKLARLLEKSLWFEKSLNEHNRRLIAVERKNQGE